MPPPEARAGPAAAEFFSFSDGARCFILLPGPDKGCHLCIGSIGGWLVTVDEVFAMHLLKLVTCAQLPLPPVTTLGFIDTLPPATTIEGETAARFSVQEDLFKALPRSDRYQKEGGHNFTVFADSMRLYFLWRCHCVTRSLEATSS